MFSRTTVYQYLKLRYIDAVRIYATRDLIAACDVFTVRNARALWVAASLGLVFVQCGCNMFSVAPICSVLLQYGDRFKRPASEAAA